MLDFSGLRILVLGDVMLDRFLYGEVERISPEAPVPVLRQRRSRAMPGGAGNVARNISALGGQAVLVGLVGRDAAAAECRALLAGDAGITDALVESPTRPTVCKMRVIAGTQQVVRIDDEVTGPADAAEAAALIAAVAAAVPNCRALILSDYAKGVLARPVVAAAIAAATAAGIPVLADPKSDDFSLYRGAGCLTPNARELGRAARLPVGTEAEVVAAARRAMAEAGLPALLCTRAEKGMVLVRAEGTATSVPAEAREVFDVSGAGDTVIATLALAHAAGRPLEEAMRIANAAAGIVVGKLGTATVSADELEHALRAEAGSTPGEEALLDHVQAQRLVAEWKAHGLRVGFTNGCFDILHAGHVALLRAARKRCDRLVVALNTDASVARLKGPARPVNGLADRAAVVSALAAVDAVVGFGEDTPLALIRLLLPDVLVKGADYTVEQVVGADVVQQAGGEVALIDLVPGRSTTATIRKLRQ
ncbi:bifunctional D-glycero-beta-D-manno-heptose-7-phosphate kinase/D-glycero-beta-D-manno-heptose 1-phosphate adenylyltransferase HldE [Siccirubricoccus deserti]|uniref:Bifunctional protein HldE n=1 Tax=Siccirubricoccus deserti TaxID=2013562 RepID=A0A9X0R1E2_9PROT|nr:bifunctional D-glycero-beta-D-manno-heptose-7-phosphate kinase/D-glycero-beta-D-manno-heptose 1-phosphate adenylyltransferase HldE [Siccirubricoccus deserti]MBC4017765.1 bifunctional D-glycero-beta-D-manno-heptose-7-phosphate kinase/D-glycero-beta-D-manno-heptose 1-phosphate adenylyltransferase HldE [Siccirubricoccus deserti]